MWPVFTHQPRQPQSEPVNRPGRPCLNGVGADHPDPHHRGRPKMRDNRDVSYWRGIRDIFMGRECLAAIALAYIFIVAPSGNIAEFGHPERAAPDRRSIGLVSFSRTDRCRNRGVIISQIIILLREPVEMMYSLFRLFSLRRE